MRMRLCCLAVLLCLSSAAHAADNFLIVVADDVGVDKIGAYAAGECWMGTCPAPPPTPVIDGLAADGVLFRNAWTNPSCSPTRATLLSGRYGFRTGVGAITPYVPESPTRVVGLDPADPNIANSLKTAGYDTAAFGKWHVGGCTDVEPTSQECLPSGDAVDPAHSIEAGFDYHAGTTANIGQSGNSYCSWPKTVSQRTGPGPDDYTTVTTTSTTYATVDTIDEAIAHIPTMTEPWLAWVAFNASHLPVHVPPANPVNCTQTTAGSQTAMYDAMTAKMDSEIGRLLTSLGSGSDVLDRTTIIFVGDNGTYENATVPPFIPNHGKGTTFEGGVNSPFIVSGAAVPAAVKGHESAALVNSTDVFATLMEIASVSPCSGPGCADDSESVAPYLLDPNQPSLRDTVYAEKFDNTRGYIGLTNQVVRGVRFKLMRIVNEGGPKLRLYDLDTDPFEGTDLLLAPLGPSATTAFADLGDALFDLTGICVDLADLDGDCVLDTVDNCDDFPNGPLAQGVPGVGNQTDADSDGLGDACDPNNDLEPDDDDDGLLDVVETDTGTYVDPSDTGTDLQDPDSDGDWVGDGNEVLLGADPTAAASIPESYTEELALLAHVSPPLGLLDFDSLTSGAILTSTTVPVTTTIAVGIEFPPSVPNLPNPGGAALDWMVVEDTGSNPSRSGLKSLGLDDPGNDDMISAGTSLALSFDTPVDGFGLRIVTSAVQGVDIADGSLELEVAGNPTLPLQVRDGELLGNFGGQDYYSYLLVTTSQTRFSGATVRPGAGTGVTDFFYNVDDMFAVPEPAPLLLLLAGIAGLAGLLRTGSKTTRRAGARAPGGSPARAASARR